MGYSAIVKLAAVTETLYSQLLRQRINYVACGNKLQLRRNVDQNRHFYQHIVNIGTESLRARLHQVSALTLRLSNNKPIKTRLYLFPLFSVKPISQCCYSPDYVGANASGKRNLTL